MKRPLTSAVLGVLLCAAPASAAPIVSNWSDVGSFSTVPGYSKVQIANFNGNGLADEILSGPGLAPAVLMDSYTGEANPVLTLSQMERPSGGPADAGAGGGGYVAAGDLNGDGIVDLVQAVTTTPSDVRWMLSSAPRSPTHPLYTTHELLSATNAWGTARDVALADADGDGDLDAFVDFDGRLGILHNDGHGNFAAPVITPGLPGATRISVASLASPARYAGGAFVPPTVFLSRPTVGSTAGATLAFVPAGGLTYATTTLTASSPMNPVSPSQVLATTITPNGSGATQQLDSFSGTAFTQPAAFPAPALTSRFVASRSSSCAPATVGSQLVNTVTKTFALGGTGAGPGSSPSSGLLNGEVLLYGQPSGEAAVREIRDIWLPTGTTVCAMAMGPLGASEGGGPDDLVVLASGNGSTPSELFIFHGQNATDGSARAGGPTGPPARLASRRVKVRRGKVTLRFTCPRKAKAGCPLQSSLTPSVGTASPYVVAAVVRPGGIRTAVVTLSPDAVAKAKHGTLSLRVRRVATGRGGRAVLVG